MDILCFSVVSTRYGGANIIYEFLIKPNFLWVFFARNKQELLYLFFYRSSVSVVFQAGASNVLFILP